MCSRRRSIANLTESEVFCYVSVCVCMCGIVSLKCTTVRVIMSGGVSANTYIGLACRFLRCNFSVRYIIAQCAEDDEGGGEVGEFIALRIFV